MSTFATIVPCENDSNRITIFPNNLGSSVNYHSLNPLKSNIADLRHVYDNLTIEVIFYQGQNLIITTKSLYLSNFQSLSKQNAMPIESVNGVQYNTIEELIQAILFLIKM